MQTCVQKILKRVLLFLRKLMHAMAPKEAPTSRSEGSKLEWIERTCDYVIACCSLKGNISQMMAVEDSEWRPQKAASFVVERQGDTGVEGAK